MAKFKKTAKPREYTLYWKITPCGCVKAFVGKECKLSVFLDSFYTSAEEAHEEVEMLKVSCVYEGLDVRDAFSKLVSVVKAHFNLGTVMYMHMFEELA